MAAMLLSLPAIVPGQPRAYEITLLDPPPAYTELYPTAINNAGEIVGTAVDSITGSQAAVIWRHGVAVGLDGPVGSASHGNAINDVGVVVGDLVLDQEVHAFVWDGEVMRDLGVPGHDSGATSINSSGVIVGYERDNIGNAHAMLWERNVGHRLDRFESGFSSAIGISDLDQTVLTAYVSGAGGIPDSYVSNNGTLALLGAFQTTAVNASGQVTGYRATPLPEVHGIVWEAGTTRELGDRDTAVLPLAINGKGQIVGSTWTSMGDEHAVIWEDGQLRDLNESVDSSSGWGLWRATALNNADQIVGLGVHNGQQSAFLLTPLDP